MGPITVARTIQLILAPVVMVTASGIIVGALLPRYDAISNRLRAMQFEAIRMLQAGLMDAESDSAPATGVFSQSSESRPAGKS